ncbi:MAG: DUF1015 domain-containing protein [Candidatus Omnitrophica bacterium]|nr:DUF1015 domain-containing protein [Candidatus Omnitrophota bacterium]
MPRIQPLKGILYNPKKTDISNVVAPPYDVISPEMQDVLYRKSDYNIVRLILGKEEPGDSDKKNKYTRARQYMHAWLERGILEEDKTEAIYVYSQEYSYGGRKKTSVGFLARMEIEDPRKSKVLPHEYTFLKPKQDRLNLIRQVRANLSPIFTLFSYDEGIGAILKSCLKAKPDLETEQDGVRHKLWRLSDKNAIGKIQEFMLDKEIYIADGHHRYEVAVSYRDEMHIKEDPDSIQPYDYVMMYFSPLDEEGLTILSTHRLVKNIYMDTDEFLKRLDTYFYVKKCASLKELFKEMGAVKNNEYAFGIYPKGKPFYFLKLKDEAILDEVIKEDKSREWKRLDVSILHGVIFDHILNLRKKIQDEDNIIYTRDADYAKEEMDKGKYEAAFFLNPTKVKQVRDIARIGDRMPHKSTYFYPKLLSGLVINKIS